MGTGRPCAAAVALKAGAGTQTLLRASSSCRASSAASADLLLPAGSLPSILGALLSLPTGIAGTGKGHSQDEGLLLGKVKG